MEMLRLQRAGLALATSAIVALAGSGCGGSEAVIGEDATAAENQATTPEAAQAPVETRPAAPVRPKTLELLRGGNPTVYVRIDKTLELYDAPDGKLVKTVGHSTEFGSRTVFAVAGERKGWIGLPTPFVENGSLLWAKPDPKVLEAGRSTWNVEIDLSDFEATVLRDGKVERRFPVSIGAADTPTPTGSFAVTDTFRGNLNPAYGCCAIALTARQHKLASGWLGGDRIAIHGTAGSLGFAVSNGCVRAVDTDVSSLVDSLPLGTPVEIRQ